jgi:AcrR family transcriptional regulator
VVSDRDSTPPRFNEGGAVPGPKPDPTGAKILDGAIRVLGDFGVKRATVELVAKYAGVSHMTIYRRWPSKNDLLKTAVIGEFTTLLDTAFETGWGWLNAVTEYADHFMRVGRKGNEDAQRAVRSLSSDSLSDMKGRAFDLLLPV